MNNVLEFNRTEPLPKCCDCLHFQAGKNFGTPYAEPARCASPHHQLVGDGVEGRGAGVLPTCHSQRASLVTFGDECGRAAVYFVKRQ